VDLGANVEMSCLYWLAAYWRAEVIAFEPNPAHAAQCRATLERNGWLSRVSLHSVSAGARFDIFPLLANRRIDILELDIHGSHSKLLEDPRFEELDVRAIVLSQDIPEGRREHAWCIERLQTLGFQPYPKFEKKGEGRIWAYRKRTAAAPRAPSTTDSLYRPTQELSGHRS
jgi:FkbM family methyltransferase